MDYNLNGKCIAVDEGAERKEIERLKERLSQAVVLLQRWGHRIPRGHLMPGTVNLAVYEYTAAFLAGKPVDSEGKK